MKISTDARLPQNESLQALKQRLYEIHRDVATQLNAPIAAASIVNTPSGNIAATEVQAAINELDAAIALRYGTNNILGAVSQSAGVPTGAAIESGSNANGTYTRFADGTQICALAPVALALAAGTPLATVLTYPAAFSATPTWCPATQNMSASYAFHLTLSINGTGLAGGVLVAHATFAQTYTISGVVVGRWF